MSRQEQIQVECPQCHEKQQATMWTTLNSMLDPQAKMALLRGEINAFQCVKCKKITTIDAELLYHDMEKHYAAKYYPFRFLDDETIYEDFTADAEMDLPEGVSVDAAYLRKTHIVFSMVELVRYIIFRDRLAEHIKRL